MGSAPERARARAPAAAVHGLIDHRLLSDDEHNKHNPLI